VSKIIRVLGANSTADFAIRSGGHSHWAGGSNVDNGVTIDLGLLKGTEYDPATSLASVLPGGRWADVFKELEKHSVAVPGGRDGNVGVAGFLTGGGNSYYTGRAGFGCDSIVNVEIVLADGSIVNANKDTNPDLLKALKGGSGNLGIVTRFDLQTFPAGNVWGGIRASELSQGDAIAHAMVNFTNNNEKNPEAAYLINWTYNPGMSTDVLVAQVLVDTNGVERPAAFDEALDVPELFNDISVRPVSDMAESYVLPSGL
jgi:FAD/FMN-containing dehydrogenase